MSSRSSAQLARAVLFALEALEPRRFLSADGAVEGQQQSAVSSDAIVLNDHDRAEVKFATNSSAWFSFQAQAGTHYSIYDGFENLHMEIYGPDGATKVAESRFQQAIFTAASSGTHFVKVVPQAGRPGTDGEYWLSVDSLPEAVDPVTTEWDLQSPISGRLESPYDLHYVRFEASAGQTYVFNAHWYNIYTLLDSDRVTALGQVDVKQSGGETHGTLRWTAPHSGSFYILVSDLGIWCMCSSNGEWGLRAMLAPSDGGLETASSTAPGSPASGVISQPGEMDYLRFEAVEHAYYSFDIATDQGDTAAVVNIIGPRSESQYHWGVNLRYDMDFGPTLTERMEWDAPASGTFYVSVSFLDARATGAYTITMNEALDDHGDSPASATVLEIGQPQSMREDYPWDEDYFSVPALAGHTYLLTARGGGDDYPVRPGDMLFAETVYWGAANRHSFMFTASESKNYYFGFDGVYEVEALEAQRPLPEPDAPAIAPNGSLMLSLDRPGAVTYIRFETQPGMEYQFDAGPRRMANPGLSRIGNPGMYVVDSSGELADEQYLAGPGMVHRLSNTARTLYLAVVGLDKSQVGQFAIHFRARGYRPARPETPPPVQEVPPVDKGPADDDELDDSDAPAPMPVTTILIRSTSGAIKSGGSNLFVLHAIAGRSYRLRTVLESLEDTVLGLFDAITQTVIAVNDDTDDEALWDDDVQSLSSQVEWTAEASGDVYLVVYGLDEESAGTYRLEINSTSAVLKEETLAMALLPAARATEIVAAVDDALYAHDWDSSKDDSDLWEDSQDSWDDSGDWLDSDAWSEDEDLEGI